MPYIKKERRESVSKFGPTNAGELNYDITDRIMFYWWDRIQNYQAINDILGALEGAKQEFYRRVVVPYENKKIEENGDVGYEKL